MRFKVKWIVVLLLTVFALSSGFSADKAKKELNFVIRSEEHTSELSHTR